MSERKRKTDTRRLDYLEEKKMEFDAGKMLTID